MYPAHVVYSLNPKLPTAWKSWCQLGLSAIVECIVRKDVVRIRACPSGVSKKAYQQLLAFAFRSPLMPLLQRVIDASIQALRPDINVLWFYWMYLVSGLDCKRLRSGLCWMRCCQSHRRGYYDLRKSLGSMWTCGHPLACGLHEAYCSLSEK